MNRTHGYRNTPLYNKWAQMKKRCLNENHKSYLDYGGRGITVCDEWIRFEPFLQWSIESGYVEGLSIERDDFNGNYEPSNCSWIPVRHQSRNKRNVKLSLDKAREIRRLSREGATGAALAELFGVGQERISKVINGKAWVE